MEVLIISFTFINPTFQITEAAGEDPVVPVTNANQIPDLPSDGASSIPNKYYFILLLFIWLGKYYQAKIIFYVLLNRLLLCFSHFFLKKGEEEEHNILHYNIHKLITMWSNKQEIWTLIMFTYTKFYFFLIFSFIDCYASRAKYKKRMVFCLNNCFEFTTMMWWVAKCIPECLFQKC